MTFTEDWFGEASQQALATLAKRTERLPGAVVEVGCWEGRSTVALARAVYPAIVHAVDTWAGSPGEISADLAAERDVYTTFIDNIAELTEGNVQPHVMGWREFFAERGPAPIRFLHIDAEHTEVEVFDNIAAALPMMVPGGIMCGDDAHHPPVRRAVLRHFPRAQRVASLWWVTT
jgi:predicted O-methyltransferase YrrM